MERGICRCVECHQVVKIDDVNQAQYGYVCKGQCTDDLILRTARERRETIARNSVEKRSATKEWLAPPQKRWWEIW
jgi:hypothetical protein